MKLILLLISLPFFMSSCFFDGSGNVPNPYVEHICDDGIDNDNDGFGDCEDQDCCSFSNCANVPLCSNTNNTTNNSNNTNNIDYTSNTNNINPEN